MHHPFNNELINKWLYLNKDASFNTAQIVPKMKATHCYHMYLFSHPTNSNRSCADSAVLGNKYCGDSLQTDVNSLVYTGTLSCVTL